MTPSLRGIGGFVVLAAMLGIVVGLVVIGKGERGHEVSDLQGEMREQDTPRQFSPILVLPTVRSDLEQVNEPTPSPSPVATPTPLPTLRLEPTVMGSAALPPTPVAPGRTSIRDPDNLVQAFLAGYRFGGGDPAWEEHLINVVECESGWTLDPLGIHLGLAQFAPGTWETAKCSPDSDYRDAWEQGCAVARWMSMIPGQWGTTAGWPSCWWVP